MIKSLKKTIIYILVFLTMPINLNSAQAKTENDLGLWTPVIIRLPITDKVLSFTEFQSRFVDNIGDLNQTLIREAIAYKLNSNVSIWQGYDWLGNYNPSFFNENTIWQQILFQNKYKKFKLQNRFRLEERFIEGRDTSLRFRYLLGTLYPFALDDKLALSLSNEIFVNFYGIENGPQEGFNENRLFAGLNCKLTSNVRVEGGYQMQYILNGIDTIRHNVILGLQIDLPQLF